MESDTSSSVLYRSVGKGISRLCAYFTTKIFLLCQEEVVSMIKLLRQLACSSKETCHTRCWFVLVSS